MVATVLSTVARSALPNLTPLTAQFVSKRDFGFVCWTITPTKPLQSGSDVWTASVMADCRVADAIKLRLSRCWPKGAGWRSCCFELGPLRFFGTEGEEKISAIVSIITGSVCDASRWPKLGSTESGFNRWTSRIVQSISSNWSFDDVSRWKGRFSVRNTPIRANVSAPL